MLNFVLICLNYSFLFVLAIPNQRNGRKCNQVKWVHNPLRLLEHFFFALFFNRVDWLSSFGHLVNFDQGALFSAELFKCLQVFVQHVYKFHVLHVFQRLCRLVFQLFLNVQPFLPFHRQSVLQILFYFLFLSEFSNKCCSCLISS